MKLMKISKSSLEKINEILVKKIKSYFQRKTTLLGGHERVCQNN
jgi:hypothetical protein